jgi:hypothetical protein
MATARGYAVWASLPDGRVLVAGGDGPGGVTSAEIYDPASGVFTATGPMSTTRGGRLNQMAPLPGGKFLVAGGTNGRCDTAWSSAEIFDPSTGTWSLTGSMSVARSDPSVIALAGGQVLVVGGYDQLSGDCSTVMAEALTSAEIYDPASGSFTPTAAPMTPRANAWATSLPNGDALIVAGEEHGNQAFNPTVEKYSPGGGGSFASVGMMPGQAGYGYAFTLPSGKVLLTGSFSSGTTSLFDPSASAFTPAMPDPISAGAGCAVQLRNGNVFLATGFSNGAATPETEVYFAATGTWTRTTLMSTPRLGCSIAELPDGKVLVAGGDAVSGGPLLTAEICDPAPAH